MLNRAFLCVATLLLAACGISYSLEPARFLIKDDGNLSMQEITKALGPILDRQGFTDYGVDQKMIDLIEHSPNRDESFLASLRNRYTYLHKARKLRIMLADYSDPSSPRPSLTYETPSGPFFELSIYEDAARWFQLRGA